MGISVRSAIARSDILVTNATLEVGEQQGRPIPLPLFYEKLSGGIEKGGKVYNRFLESEPDNKQLKGYRAGYIGSTNNSHLPQYAKVNLTVGTHSTIEDEYQRPTSDVGGVYSYEAIQSGTQLKTELRLRKSWADLFKQKKANWWDCLNGKDRLGQSKKDDYGAVDIKVLGKPQEIHHNNSTNNSQLTVWLLSDILLRDERLRPSTSIGDLVKELETVLGVKLEIQKQEHDKLSLITRQHRIESWQVRWGLPRPSLVGLAAGTCVVFNVNGKLDPSKLSQIEASGIGERRAEGYGQVCFNDPLLLRETSNLQQDNTENNKEPKNNSSQRLITLSDRAFTYARIVEKAAWREDIRRAVLQVATDSNKRLGIAPNQPTMSQLGALKSILGQLHKPENSREPGVVTQWLNSLEATPNRKDKWSPQSLQTIRALISDESQIWNILNLNFTEITLTSTGQQDLTGDRLNLNDLLNNDRQFPQASQITIEIHWQPQTSVMVKAEGDGIAVDIVPLVSEFDNHLSFVLPGSSIKGALRTQAERIVRTVCHWPTQQYFQEQLELPLVEDLFGVRAKANNETNKGIGSLFIDDCYANTRINHNIWAEIQAAKSNSDLRQNLNRANLQTTQQAFHVAVDRWTGGAADSFLYSKIELIGVNW